MRRLLELETGIHPRERMLTDSLVEFSLRPEEPYAAPITLIASLEEVIVSAGVGTRVELGAVGECIDELTAILRGIVSGGLTERVERSAVRFEIELEGRQNLTGRVSGLDLTAQRPGKRRYAPYY